MKEWKSHLAWTPMDVITEKYGFLNSVSNARREWVEDYVKKAQSLPISYVKKISYKRCCPFWHFFPSVRTSQWHTFSQVLIGEKMDFTCVEPMKSDSCSHLVLQDFTRKHGTSHSVKVDNTKTEKGIKWNEHCRQLHIKHKFTEPFRPWHKHAEHGIYYLSVMVHRIIRENNAPCTQHHWIQCSCTWVRNHM